MRIVGLDLGSSHIEFCELRDGKVQRLSVRRFGELKPIAGAGHGAGNAWRSRPAERAGGFTIRWWSGGTRR